MLILMGFAFLAGIVTILSPCILPVLPVVLASTASGGRSRPWGVVTGFILSFTVFTLTLSALVQTLFIDPDLLRWIAAGLVIIFGVVLVVPFFKNAFLSLVSGLTGRFSRQSKSSSEGGFWSGFVLGTSLGLVWTPCVGPIMASVISLALSSSIDAGSVLITLSYSLGTAIPLFVILKGGRALLNRFPFFLKNSGRIQQVFGGLMLVTGVLILTGLDRRIQTSLLEVFPSYGSGLTTIEENDSVQAELDKRHSATTNDESVDPLSLGDGAWINSAPVTLASLKGKVVLVDFWTYSCINCLRTMPYLRGWHERYAADGLVIVGVHSPEFAFERSEENVRKAVADLGILWPVVQDNSFGIWNAYSNRYWPAHYLYDKDGRLIDTHFGEGHYVETEDLIRKALGVSGERADTGSAATSGAASITPETYLGYARSRSSVGFSALERDQTIAYAIPDTLESGEWALEGQWLASAESLANSGPASLVLNFSARNVYLVLGPAGVEPTQVHVSVDGQPVDGGDVTNGIVTLDGERLYHLVNGSRSRRGTLRLDFTQPVRVYAFTFG